MRKASLLLVGSLLGLSVWTACGSDSDGDGGGPDGTGSTGVGGANNQAGSSGTGANSGAGTGSGGLPTSGSLCSEDDGVPDESSITAPAEAVSEFIVVDQFGYLPESEKIAVLRDPQTGFDSAKSYTPPASYSLVDATTGTSVLDAAPTAWNAGGTDADSGDKAWWFDFSSVTTPGLYYVKDATNNVRSDVFRISDKVYCDVLKQAVRTFFYQRAGFAKEAEYAGAAWADGASHSGPNQDKNAHLFSDTSPATEKDVSGGWYDAGDYNKYTSWTAHYVIELLRAYKETPDAFGDDYDIPESGNGVADIVDEARYGMDHLVRLQNEDGSVISIVDLDHASPPSAATGASLYGPPSTSATLSTAAAYAYGSVIFRSLGDTAYADDLVARAKKAWEWADANPAVIFRNNEGAATGIGAGQQEVDDYGRQMKKLAAAVELYAATGDAVYKTFFDANYKSQTPDAFQPFRQYPWVSGYDLENYAFYFDYAALPDATESVRSEFVTGFLSGMASNDNLGMLTANPDAYMAHVGEYTWGSNAHKSRTGLLFYSLVDNDFDTTKAADAERAAGRYVHYIHGVNPFGLVYLSNMAEFGATNSVTQFYHTWFNEGTAWDEVGVSQHGPAPGFLTGGANESYDLDGCCADPDNDCGGQQATMCVTLEPPMNQPPAKSYKQFNTGWPQNSWSVTENSDGYQVAYIRLLSKFVR